MSGHNKFSKIKHKKAASDAKKSKAFSMYSRQITLESKKVAGDTSSPSLRTAIEKARSINMPNETIDRAVKKGLGTDVENLEEVVYESYGPGGSAIIISGITDNKNRTSAEIKHTLSKNGYALSQQGSAMWAFEKKDDDIIPKEKMDLNNGDKESLLKLVGQLEELDDVKQVYTNTSL